VGTDVSATFDDRLTADEFFVDPYPTYDLMREQAPVVWSNAWGGWVLTRYADVVSTFKDHRRFSNKGRVDHMLARVPDEVRRASSDLERHFGVNPAHADPPDHTRMRTLLNRAFTPYQMDRLRPRVQAVVDELLDRVEARGDGRLDLVADLSFPLPAIIIAEMLGAPGHESDQFRDWANGVNQLFASVGRATADQVSTAQLHVKAIRDYTLGLAEQRRAEPQDDIISLMAHAVREGTLSLDELVSTAVTLFIAGHETTTYTLANGMLALLRHPEQLRQLRDAPHLMDSTVEEIWRYDTPVQRGWKLATEDVEIAGCRVRAGDLVLPMPGAANRDPAQFPDPHRFDITRKDNRHVAFGYGIHFCIGAPLARIELPIALSTLLRRYPRLRLAGERLEWRRDVAMRGPVVLELLY
jgi:cytochrome P450